MKGGHGGFTLIEVLMASCILVLLPIGALITTLKLEQLARTESEEMAAAAFCEDVYNRCLREEKFTAVSWKSFSYKTDFGYYISSGTAKGIYLPAVRLKDGTFYTPLVREGYKTPKYRIVNKGDHDVRVSLRWGPNLENYYHK